MNRSKITLAGLLSLWTMGCGGTSPDRASAPPELPANESTAPTRTADTEEAPPAQDDETSAPAPSWPADEIQPDQREVPPPPDVASPPAEAQKTASGVFYQIVESAPAGGDSPGPRDEVEVHYTGWTTDGKMFDSSVPRDLPATFRLDMVIPGWRDGLQIMRVGDKTRFWIPEALAYKGKPGTPQGMLVFDVELLGVEVTPDPPPVPADVAKPPASAKKTAKGVFYKVLSKGPGGPSPKSTSKVVVHYTGWTTDGEMFDSSVTRGRPATFPLSSVIPGWTDGVQVMQVGDRVRFWIPEALAYKGRPGRPEGMLVFDVELLDIVE